MLYVNILDDDILKETVNKFISAMLPTRKFDASMYTEVLNTVLKLFPVEEMSGEYYVIFSIFKQIGKLGASVKNYKPVVTRDSVDTIIQANILDLVRRDYVRIEEILTDAGYQTNLEIETNLEAACALLYKRTMKLYDDCFALKQDSREVLSYLPALRDAFVNHVAEQSLRIQSIILTGELKIGRRIFKGTEGWRNHIKYCNLELAQRLEDEDENTIIINGTDVSEKILDKLEELYQPLAPYGLPPMDEQTPMLRHRLVVICANENVGKTKFATNCVGQLLAKKKKVVFMCGENNYSLAYATIMSNYIYRTRGIYITNQMIADKVELPADKLKLLNLCCAEVAEEGLLILRKTFSYDNLYEELVALYEQEEFDALFIDHSMALTGKNTMYENIQALAIQARQFKREYPVYIQILSHLSTIAKEELMKGKEVTNSPTKGNSTLSAEADEIFILINNEILQKQNLLAVANYKRRDAGRVTENMIIRKKFNVASFEWDDKLQNSASGLDVGAEAALKLIDDYHNTTDDVDDDYGDYDDNGDWISDDDDDDIDE